MEKTTKKKKSKSLKRRIGLIAVGGLSLVLTVCLSVGATLAWFAGSTWASKSMYMGGPVYVEMTGGANDWKTGNGNLDIKAAAGRTTGTVGDIPTDVLLPGQRVEIYTSARVYSTSAETTIGKDTIPNGSSGADTSNSGGNDTGADYESDKGRKTTTTSSILRARFSIDVEFDPSVGFNNFTNTDYAENYPVQSDDFEAALNGTAYDAEAKTGRRDNVASTVFTKSDSDLADVQARKKTSIYAWKYVSASEYDGDNAITDGQKYSKMGAPLDGTKGYGVWILKAGEKTESNAFYKARTIAYMQTYVEAYVNEYGNTVERTLASSINSLNNALNQEFVNLITASNATIKTTLGYDAQWLYIDPSIGNDTNTDEISTSVGGWWYLVAGTPAKGTSEKDEARLANTLFEIDPTETVSAVSGSLAGVQKVASKNIPFVNGAFALPGDALSNVFANAKLTFKISFQALQAFLPYTKGIDDAHLETNPNDLGMGKALTIANAIPVYNEAFDYQENSGTIEGL